MVSTQTIALLLHDTMNLCKMSGMFHDNENLDTNKYRARIAVREAYVHIGFKVHLCTRFFSFSEPARVISIAYVSPILIFARYPQEFTL